MPTKLSNGSEKTIVFNFFNFPFLRKLSFFHFSLLTPLLYKIIRQHAQHVGKLVYTFFEF